MIWLFSLLAFYYGLMLALRLLGVLWVWVFSGFSFRRTREELAVYNEELRQREAQKKREEQRLLAEWQAKRRERC